MPVVSSVTRNRGSLKFASSILTGAALIFGCAAEPPPAPKPVIAQNVILVVVDTLRADRVGVMGADRPTSPRLDAIAREGTVFWNAFANSPWTVPSTATIMTSLYGPEHGAEVTGEVRHLSEQPPGRIRDGLPTLGTILAGQGFRCGLFSANPYLFGRFQDGFEPAVTQRMTATELTDLTLDFISSTRGERFFAHIQYMDLHQPIEPPEPFADFFATPGAGPRGEEHKEWSFSTGEHLETREFRDFRSHRFALYDGALRYVDSEIGRLVDALAGYGLGQDTVVIVTSDHGEEFWDHAAMEAAAGGDPRGFYGIGHGHSLFNELLSVPLVFSGPGIPAGGEVAAPMSLLDLGPTILGSLDVPVPTTMRGRDLWGNLTGIDAPLLGDDPVFADSVAYGPDAWAVIHGGWKLVERSDGVSYLFELAHDPDERTNEIEAQSERAEALRLVARKIQGSFNRGAPTDQVVVDEATSEQLRALGYVE